MAYIDNVTSILQIQPDGLPTTVRLSQNENGRNLYFQLAGNEIDIPANSTITISGTKPDGTVYSGTGSISDNVILIPEMIQMTAVAGYWDAKVKIISGGNTIATGRIRFVIDADTVDPDSVPSDSELEGLVAEAQQYAETARTEAYGSPLTAQTAAGMTDHTRVYVYTGSETGYTAGHWYFWNGSAWTDGGVYNSTAVNTDPTLTLAGVAADAKATGDAIEAARVAIDDTLTNEGEAADAAAVGSEISGLNNDLQQIPKEERQVTTTLDVEILDGYRGTNGTVYHSTTYDAHGYTDIIPVAPGDVVTTYNTGSATPQPNVTVLCAYNGNTLISGNENVAIPYTVPEGINGISLTFVPIRKSAIITKTADVTVWFPGLQDRVDDIENDISTLDTGFATLRESFNSLEEITTETSTTEETTTLDVTILDGYLASNGIIYHGTTYDTHGYVEKIPVNASDIIQTYNATTGEAQARAAVLCAYTGNTLVSGNENVPMPYTVPDGINYVSISFTPTYKNAIIKKTVIITEIMPALSAELNTVLDKVSNTHPNAIIMSFDLMSGETYNDPKGRLLQDSCGYSIAFKCKIASALSGKIIVAKGYGNYNGAAVGIDATNVYIYLNGATIDSPTLTQAHGLTLKDYISIVIDNGYDPESVKIRIKTNGGEYVYTPSFWRSHNGYLSAISVSDALTGCVLSYAVPALGNDIWMYGDSYFLWYSESYWPYWLIIDNHTSFLLNGYPGRNSITALASLKVDLSLEKIPKKIIWCLGMNDPDGSSAVNTAWKSSVEEVMSICEEKGIELILATTPNVPSSATKNTLKNAYVSESGYRYIDFAKAVSANGDSTWYDNMLMDDGVHPKKEGAKALYAAAVATVPELLK